MAASGRTAGSVAHEASLATCDAAQVTRTDAASKRARDVMLRTPKTLPHDASVRDARALFANPKVVEAVVTDCRAFVGLLSRGDVPDDAPGSAPVGGYVRRDVTRITGDLPVPDALAILDAESSSRLVVLENDGVTLAGLLCLDLRRGGFCAG
ncbi:MAG: CBS domain-containing protein [Actinomycetota bacterium]|nr:CBS domain-containing protein [Actinomycetota bacterium]